MIKIFEHAPVKGASNHGGGLQHLACLLWQAVNARTQNARQRIWQGHACQLAAGPPVTVLADQMFGFNQRADDFLDKERIPLSLFHDQAADTARQFRPPQQVGDQSVGFVMLERRKLDLGKLPGQFFADLTDCLAAGSGLIWPHGAYKENGVFLAQFNQMQQQV